jgi:Fur family peroxide stress response transcriptional regulator
MRSQFPELSATTVHRITARLAERGAISLAPSTADGSMRYDAGVQPHDHFVCQGCANIRDIDVAPALIPQIEAELGGCKISGRLLVSGTCGHCLTKEC